MSRSNRVNKILPMHRGTSNPGLFTVIGDGQPVVPAADLSGVIYTRDISTAIGNTFQLTDTPVVNAQAIVAFANPGMLIIVTRIIATLVNNNVAPSAVLNVELIDTDTPATLFSFPIQAGPNTGNPTTILDLQNLHIIVQPHNITLGFSAAGGANTFESVTLFGYTYNP